MSDDNDQMTTIRSIMKDVRVAMFVTSADDGAMHSAPMTTQEAEFDGDAWFIASRKSETVRNLQARPHVNVSYSGSTAWLSLTGTAAVVEDAAKKKELWNAFVEAWFPGGENDPDIALVKVDGGSAQYWDSPGRVAMTLDMIKARVTGNPPKSGDSDTVQL